MKRILKKHGVSLYQGEGLHFLNAMKEPVGLVLTDPPYDQVKDVAKELLAWQMGVKTHKNAGTVVLFHSPLQIPEHADERLFWVKTPSTKNFLRHCGRFVEMIAVYRLGGAFNLLHWSQMIGVYDDKLVHRSSNRYHPLQTTPVDSCFADDSPHTCKSKCEGLTPSPQALLSGELPVDWAYEDF